jgi:thymidylate synthase ThyX
MYEAKIVKDSVGPNGIRLTTMEVTLPRIVLAEFNTHRVFSRSSASSRAIPFAKLVARVLDEPFVPEEWGTNQAGMQAGDSLSDERAELARQAWMFARDAAVEHARVLSDLGVHKQIVNRLLEPFMWHTILVTSTEWENFFGLRCHRDAQPQIQVAAKLMQDALLESQPKTLGYREWHLPMVTDADRSTMSVEDLRWVSAGRCARLSYLTHHGIRDAQADIELALKLRASGHMSPFEHQAQTLYEDNVSMYGNLRGWRQLRKSMNGEAVFKEGR